MAQQFLDGTDIVSAFKQVRSEAMPKSMAAGGFLDARASDRRFDGVLEVFLSHMVPA
jgi:hypothetical protein